MKRKNAGLCTYVLDFEFFFMTPIDILGFSGVSLILLAFFLNLKKVLDTDHLLYILLNTVGAALACMASLLMEYLPFVILEGTWLVVSGHALYKRYQSHKLRYSDREEDYYV